MQFRETSLSGAYAYEGVWVRFGVCGNMSVHCNSEHLVIEKPFITANHKKNTLFMMRNGAFLKGQCRYLLQVVRYSLNQKPEIRIGTGSVSGSTVFFPKDDNLGI